MTRPWGQNTTTRSQSRPATDSSGTPLYLASDEGTVKAVHSISENRGVSMAQVAMAWVLKHPVVDAPIVGATKAHHLADAAASLDLELTDDEVVALEEHYTPRTPTFYGSPSGF